MAGLTPARFPWARGALALCAAWALVACTGMGPTGEGDAQEGGMRWLHPLKPLAHQAPVPAGAPRSRVPAVNYELNSPGLADESPEDRVPGDEGEVFQRGGASWYGFQFHNRKTASGERFDMGSFTAAHKTLPFGTRVCVRSLVNGREVLVRINDRGPYASGRIIDLSRAAAGSIDLLDQGIKQVALTIVDKDGGRCAGKTVDKSTDTDALAATIDDNTTTTTPAKKRAAPARKPAGKK